MTRQTVTEAVKLSHDKVKAVSSKQGQGQVQKFWSWGHGQGLTSLS